MISNEIDGIGSINPRTTTPEERRGVGKEVRQLVPRRDLGVWEPAADRPDPVALLEQQNLNRIPELVPIRYGRMLHSPFTYLRGSPVVMANDLAASPTTPLRTQLCGDAHLLNFGSYGTPERNMVFDLNDFDETLPGPFEWDVKRLVTSVVIAARTTGMGEEIGMAAASAAARSYRETIIRLSGVAVLDVWYERFDAEETFRGAFANLPGERRLERVLDKARHRTSAQALSKLTDVVDGKIEFRSQPPLLEPLVPELHELVVSGLERAVMTLPGEFHQLARRYKVVASARKVVGVGSVGTQCMVAAAVGRDNSDVLMLQIKEAQQSVLAPYAGETRFTSNGERVVIGQRLMQGASDPFLCWADGENGSAYYVRQLKDMKGSADIDTMPPNALAPYAEVCGRTMARAHARSAPPSPIAGYLGSSDSFERAMVRFAVSYADQTETDHAALVEAHRSGRIEASEHI